MAYSIQGTNVITDTRALESVSIKLDNTAIVVTDIIDSAAGINTSVPREAALFTEKALMDNIITPIYSRLDDAVNPTDADYSTTAFQAASLEALTGNIVATAGQFTGDGQGLTNLQAGSVVGALADANVAETNVTQHEAALAIDGTQLTGVAADAFIPASNVTQHEAALSIASSQLTGTADDAFIVASNVTQHQAALSIAGTQLTGTAADAFIPASAVTQHEAALSIDASTQLTGTVQDSQFPAILPAVSAENLTNISADTITVAADAATVGGLPVLFTDGDTGAQNPKANSTFTFNPSTGTIEAPGGINDTSDARVKENIVEIEDGLAKVNALRGVTFDWNEAAGIEGGSVGVIAQELLAVLPEAVNTTNEEKYTVNYNGAIALLISAVKELSAKVEALENS